MKIYLVVNCLNSPGRIACMFAHKTDTTKFKNLLNENDRFKPNSPDEWRIEERNLWYCQPPILGVNK